jgi:hypothetical protein
VLRAEDLEFFVSLQLRDRLPGGDRRGHRLPVEFGKFRLVVQRFEMAWPARHTELNHPFRFGRPMQRIDDTGPPLLARFRRAAQQLRLQQRRKRHRPKPAERPGEKRAAVGDGELVHGANC